MARRFNPTSQQWVEDDQAQIGAGTPTTPPVSAASGALGLETMGGVDPEYDALMASLQSRRAQTEADYTGGVNSLNTQYQPQYDQLAAQQNEIQKALAAQMANNGMYRSGNYLQGAGDIGNQFQQAGGALQGQQNASMQDLLAKRLNAMTGYGNEEAAGQTAFAGRRGVEAAGRARQEADTQAANEAAQAEQARNMQEQASMQPNATGQYEPAPWSQPAYSQNPGENTMMDWFNEMQRYQDNPFMMNQALNSFNNGWGSNPNVQAFAQDPRMLEIRRRLGIE